MKTEGGSLMGLFLFAAILFLFGFISFFYTKRLQNWYIKVLHTLHKKRLALFYEFRLNMVKKKWFIIYLKIWGLVVMLAGIFLLSLLIRWRH